MVKRLAQASLVVVGLTGLLGASKANPKSVESRDPNKIILTADNMLVLGDEFNGSTTAAVAEKARSLDSKIPSSDPLYLVLNSPGGEIDAGLEMIEALNSLNRPVHTITMFSASMGFQTVQGVKGERLILENGTLMSHKARGGFRGEFPGQLDARYAYYLKRIVRMDLKTVARTKGKQTIDSYRSLYENEYWCDGADCVNDGFADRVVTVSCGESLKGTEKNIEDSFTFFGKSIETTVERAKCPMSSGSLSANVYVNGKSLFSTSVEKLTAVDAKKASNPEQERYSYFNSTKTYNQSAFDDMSPTEIVLLKQEIDQRLNKILDTSRKVIKGY